MAHRWGFFPGFNPWVLFFDWAEKVHWALGHMQVQNALRAAALGPQDGHFTEGYCAEPLPC